jgi:hypothetical protein
MLDCSLPLAADRVGKPPTSSSLADEKCVGSLLLSTPARDPLFDCSLRSRGSRFGAAAFLSHSQTKSASARSLVQDSGARSWARVESHVGSHSPDVPLEPSHRP